MQLNANPIRGWFVEEVFVLSDMLNSNQRDAGI
jgi:hypothetical protein